MGQERIRELLAQAEYALNEEFPPNIEQAFQSYQEALSIDENSVETLDAFGELLADLGDSERAIQVFMKSVSLAPESGPSKYFYLGQMMSGTDALNAYKKSFTLMEQQHDPKLIDRMVGCLCAIGELFMTDLCDEEEAEQFCQRAFEKAVSLSPNSVEALNGLATFHRIRLEIEKSKDICTKAFDIMASAIESSEDGVLDEIAPLPLRQRFAENLVELELIDEALSVLATILEEDEEDIQSWFLTACCHLVGKEKEEAVECLKQGKRLLKKLKNEMPPQMVQHWTKNFQDLESRLA
jgi:tetratricopeptide (TPR) repeat protein